MEIIEIPISVNKIELSAFESCTNLKEVYIHNSNIRIDRYAFSNCNSVHIILNEINNEIYEKFEDKLYKPNGKKWKRVLGMFI